MTKAEREARRKELDAALKAKQDEAEQITAAFKIEGNTVVVSADQKDALDKVVGEVKDIQGLQAALGVLHGAADYLDMPADAKVADAAQIEMMEWARGQSESVGAAFVKSDVFKDFQKSGRGNMDVPFQYKGDLAGIGREQKDLYTSYPGLGAPASVVRFGQTTRLPNVPFLQRTLHVRDLFPVQGTVSNMIEFVRVTGFTNNASVVPERAGGTFALKPQSTLSFGTDAAPVRTVAHYEAIHRNTLADEPALRGLIDNQLLYGLLMAEDNQLLNGTGTGEDVRGLFNTPGIQAYSRSAGPTTDNRADALRRAMTRTFLAEIEPTGIIVNTMDWENIELTKDDNGQYLVAMAIAIGGEKRLWRLPVVDTPMIPQNTALVGSFGLGAQIYLREDGNIRVADQHADFFLRNAVVILAEERVALTVTRPEAFVKVTLTAGAGQTG